MNPELRGFCDKVPSWRETELRASADESRDVLGFALLAGMLGALAVAVVLVLAGAR